VQRKAKAKLIAELILRGCHPCRCFFTSMFVGRYKYRCLEGPGKKHVPRPCCAVLCCAVRLLLGGDRSAWDRALLMPHYTAAGMPLLSSRQVSRCKPSFQMHNCSWLVRPMVPDCKRTSSVRSDGKALLGKGKADSSAGSYVIDMACGCRYRDAFWLCLWVTT
jgi:hypothetical protein